MAYLSESHPEIFFMAPRPGGIVNIEVPKEKVLESGGKIIGDRASVRSGKSSIKSSQTLKSSKSRPRSIFDSTALVDTVTAVPPSFCRDYRLKKAIEMPPWLLVDEEDLEAEVPPNPLQDTKHILAITLSTIMLLAAGHEETPKDHLRWTLSYLECVTDEFGNYPPNVRGILNYIKMVDDSIESFNVQKPEEEDEGDAASAIIEDTPAEEAPAEDEAAE